MSTIVISVFVYLKYYCIIYYTLSYSLEQLDLIRLDTPEESIDALPNIAFEEVGATVTSIHDQTISPLKTIPDFVTEITHTYIKTRTINDISDGAFSQIVTAANKRKPPRLKEVKFLTKNTDLGSHLDPLRGRVESRDQHPVDVLYFPYGGATLYLARLKCDIEELAPFTQDDRNYATIEARLAQEFQRVARPYEIRQGDMLAMNIHGSYVGDNDAVYPVMHSIVTTSPIRGVVRNYNWPVVKVQRWIPHW